MTRGKQSLNIWRRAALLLFAIALLLKMPAGFMPEARAHSVGFGWCNPVGNEAVNEARKLLETALAPTAENKQESQKASADQPCAFAAAAQPMAPFEPIPILAPQAAEPLQLQPVQSVTPGRGLVAPPPFATGPPLLA